MRDSIAFFQAVQFMSLHIKDLEKFTIQIIFYFEAKMADVCP